MDNVNADSKPWYLQLDYNRDDLVLNPDGGICAGTLPTLVERLTSHDYRGMLAMAHLKVVMPPDDFFFAFSRPNFHPNIPYNIQDIHNSE